jgi:hypothetical protein
MIPFTHANSFVSPGSYKGNIIWWKLLRSADQSFGHKYILLKEAVCVAVGRIKVQ